MQEKLQVIASNRKVRILLPKWVDNKVFKVFYTYLDTSKLDTEEVEKDLDIKQKLFWLAHLFELDNLKLALNKNQTHQQSTEFEVFPTNDGNMKDKNLKEDLDDKPVVERRPMKLINNQDDDNISIISYEEAPLPKHSLQKVAKEEVKTKLDFSKNDKNYDRTILESFDLSNTYKQKKNLNTEESICKIEDSNVGHGIYLCYS